MLNVIYKDTRRIFVIWTLLVAGGACAHESQIEKALERYQNYFVEALSQTGVRIVNDKNEMLKDRIISDSKFDFSKAYFIKPENKQSDMFALHFGVEVDENLDKLYFSLNAMSVNKDVIELDETLLPGTEITIDLLDSYDTARNNIERSIKDFSKQLFDKTAKNPEFGFRLFNFFPDWESTAYADDYGIERFLSVIGGLGSISLGFYIFRQTPFTKVKDRKIIAARATWRVISGSLVILGLKGLYQGMEVVEPKFEITDLGRK